MRAPARLLRPLALCVLLLAGCETPTTDGLVPRQAPPAERDVELFVQRRLEDARAFRAQGRLEPAEHALERALAVAPDDAAVHRLMARVLEEEGRMSDARAHWARADALDPLPPPPPDGPLALDASGLVVLLVQGAEAEPGLDARARRPDPALERALIESRVRLRLPAAEFALADPESIADARAALREQGARAALTLRTDRGFCGSSVKDGDFGVAWLRVASATPVGLVSAPITVREVVTDPPTGDACVRLALSRALERALLESGALRALSQGRRGGDWPNPALRALFPSIGRQVAEEIERGRARLATGRIAEAAESFQAALRVDPEDADALAYLREAEETLAIARSLGQDVSARPGELQFSLTPAERAIAESLLAEERERRDSLLAVLVVSEVEERPPPPEAVARLRPLALPAPPAVGPRLARERHEGAVEARGLYADDGAIVATYYFPAGSQQPLLREEDLNDDGRADRWIAYVGDARRELLEDRSGDGRPDVHVRFAPDAEAVERIELDPDDDGRPERVFQYADGRLASEARDTDGDGRLDRFETFDAAGAVTAREEDLNADGRVDVKSSFRDGRLVSREIEDPSVVESLLHK